MRSIQQDACFVEFCYLLLFYSTTGGHPLTRPHPVRQVQSGGCTLPILSRRSVMSDKRSFHTNSSGIVMRWPVSVP